MKNLIVTADDFGVFPSVNEAIIDAVKAKKVNSVSVFANYKGEVLPGAPAGTRFETSLANARWLVNETEAAPPEIGCHLTVTSGKPLTGERMDFLCDAWGNFRSFKEYTNFRKPEQLSRLKDELCAQIEELKSVCTVKHLTNHHNSLTLFEHHLGVYVQVAQQFGLPMRSVDIRPADRQKHYISIQNLFLMDNIPENERREMKKFQERIKVFFGAVEPKVNAPAYMDSSHYGPIGLLPAGAMVGMVIRHKRKELERFFTDFESNSDNCAEFLVHLAKPENGIVNRSRHLNYAGVDRNYFDSRALEFRSIMEFEYGGLSNWFEHRGWTF